MTRRASGRRGTGVDRAAYASAAPFALVCLLFFAVPVAGMAVTALLVTEQGETRLGTENMAAVFTGANWRAVQNSMLVSFVSASIAAVVGAFLAFGITRLRHRIVDAFVPVVSSVLANSGSVALAFSFIVMLGNVGFLTNLLGLSQMGFTLYSWQGLVVMYQYFLIPTMVLVTLPAFAGVRLEWQQASAALGGGAWHFWRRVGLPVIAPSLLGGWILLFGAAFATHASAAVLMSTGAFPLVPLTIGGHLSGGAASGREGIAMALGLLMAIVAIVSLVLSHHLQRRSMAWLS